MQDSLSPPPYSATTSGPMQGHGQSSSARPRVSVPAAHVRLPTDSGHTRRRIGTGSERDSLLPNNSSSVRPVYQSPVRPRASPIYRTFLFIAIFIIFVLSVLLYFTAADITNPSVRERIKREWAQELRRHQDDVSRMQTERSSMEKLRQDWARERQGWARERQQHDEEGREWKRRMADLERREREWNEREEREKQRRGALHWGDLQPAEHCLQYGMRRYTATLEVPRGIDGKKYCMTTPIQILGVDFPEPLWCEDAGGGKLRGHWDVHDEPDCKTYFENYQDKGCTAPGSQLHRYEARMGNLLDGDDWRIMCSSTPTHLMGHEYTSPHHCANWGKYGTWGIWFVPDTTC